MRKHYHGAYRSGLEDKVSKDLQSKGIPFEYEKLKIKYVVPATEKAYTPDFRLPSGVIIETKGRFDLEDRKKHMLVKQQHPNLDIRFVFTNSKTKIRKGSPTSYGDWCTKNGFLYSDKFIPESWLL